MERNAGRDGGESHGASTAGTGVRLPRRTVRVEAAMASYGYDNFGHTTSVAQAGITLGFGYDALGRLHTQSGPQRTLTSDYDPAGRRQQLTWPDGFYVT